MRRQAGLALAAALAALAVVALALAATVRAAAGAADEALDAKSRLLGGWVAQNRLAEHALRTDWPAIGTRQGAVEQGGITFTVRETVTPTADARLRRVEVSVFDPRRPQRSVASGAGLAARSP